MNNEPSNQEPSDQQPSGQDPAEPVQPAEQVEPRQDEPRQDETAPAEPQSQDARRRLRQLLSIPERDRSDAVWDEIIALEITLAPGNRAPAPGGEGGQQPGRRQEGRRPDQARRQQAPTGAKPPKRFPKKSKRGQRGPSQGR